MPQPRSIVHPRFGVQHALREVPGRNPSGRARMDSLGSRHSKAVAIDDLLQHYRRHAELRNTPRTLELNLSILRRFISFARRRTGLRIVPISKVTPALIEEFSLARKRSGRTAWTVNRELGALSVYFACAVRMGAVANNPVRRVIKLPVVRNRVPRTLKPEEAAALVAEAERSVPFHGRGGKGVGNGRERITPIADMVRFALNTGARLGELLHLEWADIDLDRGLVHFANKAEHTLKSRQDRVVRMNRVVLGLLRRRRRSSESRSVFSGALGQRLDRANALREIKIACRRAGVPWAHWLALRRTFLTRCAAVGMPPFVLREIAGHSSIRTTELYYIGAVEGPLWTPPVVTR